MKKYISLVLAAILGSGLTMGVWWLADDDAGRTVKIEHLSSAPVIGAAYTVNNQGEIVPLEFTKVAKEVMPAVVHIKSTRMHNVRNYQYRQYPDPFRDFFDGDIFEHFFGPQFRFEQRGPQQQGPQPAIGSGSGVIINSEG